MLSKGKYSATTHNYYTQCYNKYYSSPPALTELDSQINTIYISGGGISGRHRLVGYWRALTETYRNTGLRSTGREGITPLIKLVGIEWKLGWGVE